MQVTLSISSPKMEKQPKVSVAEKLMNLVKTVGDSGILRPRDRDFAVRKIDQLPEEAEACLIKTISMIGVPDANQISLLQVKPDWVEYLPDVSVGAQKWLLRKNISVGDLIDKIPTLHRLSVDLIGKAVSSNLTDPKVALFLLTNHNKELEGLKLRRKLFEINPELVKEMPSTIKLTPDEQMVIVKSDPTLYEYLRNPTSAATKAYRDAEGDFFEDDKPTREDLNELLSELREARALKNAATIERLEDRIGEIQKVLGGALNKGDEESESSVADAPLLDLPSKTISLDSTKYLVLQQLPIDTLDDLPNSLFSAAKGVDIPKDQKLLALRLLNLKTVKVVLAIVSEQAARGFTASTYADENFNNVVAGLKKGEKWNKIEGIIGADGADLDRVSVGTIEQPDGEAPEGDGEAPQGEEEPEVETEGEPAPEVPAIPVANEAALQAATKNIQNLTKFVRVAGKLVDQINQTENA